MTTIVSAWKGNFDTGFTTVEFTSYDDGHSYQKTNEWDELRFLSDKGYWQLTSTEVEVKCPTKSREKDVTEIQNAWFLTSCDGKYSMQVIKPRDDIRGRNLFVIESITSYGPYVALDIAHHAIPKGRKRPYISVEMATYNLNDSQYVLKAKLYNEMPRGEFQELVTKHEKTGINPHQQLFGYVSLYPMWDNKGKASYTARYAYLVTPNKGDQTWTDRMKTILVKNVVTLIDTIDAPQEVIDFWGDSSIYDLPQGETKTFRGLGMRRIDN